jgi:hypothetical protein
VLNFVPKLLEDLKPYTDAIFNPAFLIALHSLASVALPAFQSSNKLISDFQVV